MGGEQAQVVAEHHARRLRGKARQAAIDLDPIDDPTPGQPQLSFFTGHYNSHGHLPMAGLLSFNDEADTYTFNTVLRPGNTHASRGAIGILSRIDE